MALRYPSTNDMRCFVGGVPIHGETSEQRTLLSMSRSATQHTFPRTVIGDAHEQHGYLRRAGARMSLSGLWDERFGLHPVIAAGSPGAGGSNDGLPVTFSSQGIAAGSRSTIAEHGVWTGQTITSSDGMPAQVEAECELSNYTGAYCIAEQVFRGGSTQNTAGLSLRGRDIPVRQTTNVLEAEQGDQAFGFQVAASDVGLFREDEAIEFPGSQVSGIFYITNIVSTQGVAWANITVTRNPSGNPPASLSAFSLSDRRSVQNVSVVSEQSGERAALVHVSAIALQGLTRIAVEPQGQQAGSNAWTPILPAVNLDGLSDGDRRALWFDIPDGTHSSTAVRVQLRVATSLGVLGGRPDYSVGLRADFASRGANLR